LKIGAAISSIADEMREEHRHPVPGEWSTDEGGGKRPRPAASLRWPHQSGHPARATPTRFCRIVARLDRCAELIRPVFLARFRLYSMMPWGAYAFVCSFGCAATGTLLPRTS
jgi:hypothetical protein